MKRVYSLLREMSKISTCDATRAGGFGDGGLGWKGKGEGRLGAMYLANRGRGCKHAPESQQGT